MDILIQAGQFLLGLSILIILHELGHFIPAKLFKTRVEKFYLFFDAWFSLAKKKIGGTEYGIGWLPLGGYVKISGMIDESMDKEQMKKEPEPWEFRAKPAWQRLIIMAGGVIVNVIVAYVIYTMLLFSYGEQYIPAKNAVYGVHVDSVAQTIGFRNGDQIIALNGVPVEDETYGELTIKILLDNITHVTVKRDNQETTVTIPEDFDQSVLKRRKGLFQENVPYVIDTVIPKYPAAQADLQKGDQVIGVNGESKKYFMEIVETLKNNKEQLLTLTILRENQEMNILITPNKDGLIGAFNVPPSQFLKIKNKEYTFAQAIPAGFAYTKKISTRYIDQFKLIFTKEGVKQMGGFGTISKLYGSSWNWRNFWEKTAYISAILAIMNILPIPALDGGHILFLLYEIITRRKPNEKVMEYAQVGGMLLLLAFLLYANGMDVFRAFK